MKQMVILGGGFGGFYTAQGLERDLRPNEAEVTLVDINGMLIYQPFLPEVAGGSIESRHIQMPLRRHLKKTRVVQACVDSIDSAHQQVHVSNVKGKEWTIPYDTLVVALGAVTKTFPIPGIADNAVGLKALEEAVYIRNRLINIVSVADGLSKDDPVRQRMLNIVVIGGGFSGMEGIAELRDLANRLCKEVDNVKPEDVKFHLIEATDRIMPELSEQSAAHVVENLTAKGIIFHLNTCAQSAVDGVVTLSDGQQIPSDLIIWTAGTKACPALAESDLPLDDRGRLTCNTKLQVVRDGEVVRSVWGLGDATRVEDLSGGGLPDGSCAPTAQHAVRQAKRLASNLIRDLRGEPLRDYVHNNAGAVAGLGQNAGVFTNGKKTWGFSGWPAWMGHRVYHGLAMPSLERRIRIWCDWTESLLLGRDTTSTPRTQRPREFFEHFALRP